METFKTTFAQLVALKKYVFIILPVLFIFSCSIEDDIIEDYSIESTLIAKNNLYGDGAEGINQQNLVITDSNMWNNLLNQMNTVNTITDSFIETDIDFSIYHVIAVFDDIKGSGGHSLELSISRSSETIFVKISNQAPEGNATSVITQPFHIVKIPVIDLPIIFE